jgi:branched-chain amino acid transport system ATP-binding protein
VTALPTDASAADRTSAHGATLCSRQLRCGYGSLTVVRAIDLEVASGEVLALLGPNGAGKSTLLLTIAGILPRLEGSVTVAGRAIPSGRAAAAARAGLVLVPDDRALFPDLTVEENIEVARRRASTAARDMLQLFPALEPRWKLRAGSLSGGEQQMLAMARALVQSPKVLLIDELSMGLAPVIVETLLMAVRRVADEAGAAVVVVEQHVNLALQIADRAAVLVHGEVALSGPADELARHPHELEAAYLGAGPRET